MWEMPSLSPFLASGHNFKASFNAFVDREFGVDATKAIWRQIDQVIAEVFVSNRQNLVDAQMNYQFKRWLENFHLFNIIRLFF